MDQELNWRKELTKAGSEDKKDNRQQQVIELSRHFESQTADINQRTQSAERVAIWWRMDYTQ